MLNALLILLSHSFTPTEEGNHSEGNSVRLTECLSKLTIPQNAKLLSFDVTNLFISVPVSETLKLAEDILIDSAIHRVVRDELIALMSVCTKQNYFLFNNQFYTQEEGLAMGSPLSPLLAEIFMDHLENKLFQSKVPLLSNVFYWYRYVDDVLCCWTGSHRQAHNFLTFLNSLHPRINFTMEMESDGILNFLDLSISTSKNKHEFAIFRKPTFTDHVIPYDSFYPWSHKTSAFNHMINRTLSIPLSNNDLQKEINIIRQIAKANAYDDNLITKLLITKTKTLAIKQLSYLKSFNDTKQK